MTRSREWLVWLVPPVAVIVILWSALASPQRAFSVSVNQSPTALQYLAQMKGVLDGERQSELLPWISPVDVVLVRAAALSGTEAGATANLAWLLMLMLGSAFTAWGCRRLGISLAGACVLGILYAFSPYTLFWNFELPSVTPFLVPFAATAALGLATGAVQNWPRRDVLILFAGNLLLGFNGREYAFFGAFLTVIGAVAGAIRARRAVPTMRSALVTAAIVAATVVSLMPSVRAPRHEDPNFRLTAADGESGGVKIRQLLGPLPGHWLPALNTWTKQEGAAHFPYETANHWSRLGVVAGLGFVALLAVLMMPAIAGPPPGGETVRAASGLLLAGFLLATVGGLGSVVSLFIEPEVLAFSRMTPFFIFFSLIAIGSWVDWATDGRRRVRVFWGAIAVVALLDQMVAIRPLRQDVEKARVEYRQLHGLVGVLERQLARGARVYQLPDRTDRLQRRLGRMLPNDDLKPYLVSHQLRWRYPARTDADVREDEPRDALEPDALPERLAQDGFAAILVDRLGYDDNGEGVRAELQATGRTTLLTQTERYIAFAIQR